MQKLLLRVVAYHLRFRKVMKCLPMKVKMFPFLMNLMLILKKVEHIPFR